MLRKSICVTFSICTYYYPRNMLWYLLFCIYKTYDIIIVPVYDELCRRFLNFVFLCMNCGSELVSLFVWIGVQQALWCRLWEGTHVFVKFVLAFQHLISDCITWRGPALMTCLHLIYRRVLWTELVLHMSLQLQMVGLQWCVMTFLADKTIAYFVTWFYAILWQ